MSNTPQYRFLELSELAEKLGMDEKEFVDRLHEDGFLQGDTQSLMAFKRKLFFVEPITPRWKGGLYHKSGRFHIRVTPKGVKFFMELYVSKE